MIAASLAVLLIVTYIPVVSYGLPKLLDEDGAYTGNKGVVSSQSSVNDDSEFTIGDYSNLNWKEQTWKLYLFYY